MNDEQQLDALLDKLSAQDELEPTVALRRGVAEIPARYPHPQALGGPWGWWVWVTSAALAVTLGVVSGWVFEGPDLSVAEIENEEWDELAAIALADDLEMEWQ
jgi:hypothetical protein